MAFPDIPVPTGPNAPGACDALLQSAAAAAGIVNIIRINDLAQLQIAVANCLANGLDAINYPIPTGPNAPGSCQSMMLSAAAAAGITGLNRLPGLAQLQIVVANLLAAGITPTIPVPASLGSASAVLQSVASQRGLHVQGLPALAQLQIAAANLTALANTDPALTTFVVTPDSLTPTVGTEVEVTAQAKDQFGANLPGVITVTWSETGGGTLASPTSDTDAGGLATNTLTVSNTPFDNETVTATSAGKSGTSDTIETQPGGDVDPDLQPWEDGDYDGGHFRVYAAADAGENGGFPDAGDTLLIDETLPTPAIDVILAPSNLLLAAINGAAVLASSDATEAKYIKVTTPADTDPYFASLGLAGSIDGDDPDCVIDDDVWYEDDEVDFDNIHMKSVTDTLDAYDVQVSTTSPDAGGEYTATAQAIDALDADVHRIGITLTPSSVGATAGSVDPATVPTNAYGLSAMVTVTAGATPGNVEHIHVTDGTNTGDSENVTPIAANVDLTVTELDSGGHPPDASNPTVSASVTVPAGSAMLVGVLSISHLTPTATGLTFTEDAYTTISGGHFSVYSSGKIAAGFSGTVSFPNGGQNLSYVIAKMVPDSAVTSIEAVGANTAAGGDNSGTVDTLSINYPQSFGDVHNLAVALWGNYTPVDATPRSGWVEDAEVLLGNDGNPLGLELQSKLGGDTAGSVSYASSDPLIIWGAVLEYVAAP